MEVVRCDKHNRPCMLKTGVKEGSGYGRSFYVCSYMNDRCQFVKEMGKLPAKFCSIHENKMVELQMVHHSRTTQEKRQYHRCLVGRAEKLSWCGYWLLETNLKPPTPLKEVKNKLVSLTNKPSHEKPTKDLPDVTISDTMQNNKLVTSGDLANSVDVVQRDSNSSQSALVTHDDCRKSSESKSEETSNFSQPSDVNKSSDPAKRPVKPVTSMMSFGEIASANDCIVIDDSSDNEVSVTNASFTSWRDSPKPTGAPRIKNMQDSTSKVTSLSAHDDAASKSRVINDRSSMLPPPSDGSTVQYQIASAGSLQQKLSEKEQLTRMMNKQMNLLRTVNVNALPDRGARLQKQVSDLSMQVARLEVSIRKQQAAQPQVQTDDSTNVKASGTTSTSSSSKVSSSLSTDRLPSASTVPVTQRQTKMTDHVNALPLSVYQQMYAANPQAMTLYGGRMTVARLREVGQVTEEALEGLHSQLDSCPPPTSELDDPSGLTVPLMIHQRQALSWLTWREKQRPPGGILADDMGLGKTLTIISLVLRQRQQKEHDDQNGKEADKRTAWLNKKHGGKVVSSQATLIICPASLVHQWHKEIERRCHPRLLSVIVYHGPDRSRDARRLAKADIVLSTYNIISKEVGIPDEMKADKLLQEMPVTDKDDDTVAVSSDGQVSPLLNIGWQRIVLDEAHSIKNHKSVTAISTCRLRALSRWALTGTPIQNNLLDMYSLLRFLRCSPFDEYKVWKRQVDNKSSKGTQRLNMLVQTLLLRRTKNQMDSAGKPLVVLPEKNSFTHKLKLSSEEQVVYDKIYKQSKATVQDYLRQHDKDGSQLLVSGDTSGQTINHWARDDVHPSTTSGTSNAQPMKRAGGGQILLLLLRLRQCCSHLSLMKNAMDAESLQMDGIDLQLMEQMTQMALQDTDEPEEPEVGTASKSSRVFQPDFVSTKVAALVKELKAIKQKSAENKPMKSVVVSQWTQMLAVIEAHLIKVGLRCCTIRGDVPAKKRMEMVEQFNCDPYGPEVMLVSLRAGGCGLNLIGGNHLFVMDLHWNPALESQACDRIYRMGQEKAVYVHKFLCENTIEENIASLQRRKMSLAKDVLAGVATSANKLTLEDIRQLFGLDAFPTNFPR